MRLAKGISTFLVLVTAVCSTAISGAARAVELPARPSLSSHPSSDSYTCSFKRVDLNIDKRLVAVYLPTSLNGSRVKFPVISFGHGQAISIEGYERSFEHFAKKCVGVIFPQYDKNFFDRNWRRMAADFNSLTMAAVQQNLGVFDQSKIIYSGHSKGAYVALMAAGAPNLDKAFAPMSLVMFQPAGFDQEYLRRLNVSTPATLVWSDADSIIERKMIDQIYALLPNTKKQILIAKSFVGTQPELKADHFFTLSKKYVFGGRDGLHALHFYAFWPWLLGAALDPQYLYGEAALETGLVSQKHEVIR